MYNFNMCNEEKYKSKIFKIIITECKIDDDI